MKIQRDRKDSQTRILKEVGKVNSCKALNVKANLNSQAHTKEPQRKKSMGI
mgnify:CR=1 FL=1